MGYTDTRGTAPMDRISGEPGRQVGVVSLSPGAGSTFVCRMLERELRSSNETPVIVDLGEARGGKNLDRVLIVADCSVPPGKNLEEMIRFLNKRGLGFGIILNKYRPSEEANAMEEVCTKIDGKIPVFRIPVIDTTRFTDLYNYVFYS